jgi:Tol biopolymer transport system component
MNAVPVSADGTRINGPLQRLAFVGGTTARLSAAFTGRTALSAETSEAHIWAIPIDSKGSATGVPKQVTYGRAGESSPSLSADGEKLSFLSPEGAKGIRLFYKDLASGREKEVSTEGYRYETPVFNHDGTKIMCVQYPQPDSWRNFVSEITIAGGFSRKVWDKSTFSWLYDWSPDDSALLLNGQEGHNGINALDLRSATTSNLLAAGSEKLDGGRFSRDGRWVVFTSTPWMQFVAKPSRSSIFVAPFRKTLVPRSEWIPITGNNLDFYANFSYSDKLIYFTSERDGFPCVWAQKLGADMHPDGTPFPVYHSHERRSVLGKDQVGPHAIVFERTEMSGNIWLLEPAEGSAK